MIEQARQPMEKPKKGAGHKEWKMWIDSLGDTAKPADWQRYLEAAGVDATQEEWDTYLELCDLGVDAGKEQGDKYDYGFDEAFSEEWMQAEDDADKHELTQDHNPFCPLRLGKGLNVNIDQPGDRPLEDMFDEE